MSVFDNQATYPAISLHQPFAGLIRLAAQSFDGKTIETRKTRINYRGPLVISASNRGRHDACGFTADDMATFDNVRIHA